MKLGIKEAYRMKKDLNLEEMNDDVYFSVLRNYIELETEEESVSIAKIYLTSYHKIDLGLLGMRYDNSYIKDLFDNIAVSEADYINLNEQELIYVMRVIGDNIRYKDLKEYLQKVGENVFNW